MRVVMFYHSLVSDWNHGNAHFLRGVATELLRRGHEVKIFEPHNSWSLKNLVTEHGHKPVYKFHTAYPSLTSTTYDIGRLDLDIALDNAELVLVHEWSDPQVVEQIGKHRSRGGRYKLLFHDTHHRLVTAPESMAQFDLSQFDGVLAYGKVLQQLHEASGRVRRAWTWHEAADTKIFQPIRCENQHGQLVWIGNWGDGERTAELQEYLIEPVKSLKLKARAHGVRYPQRALKALAEAEIEYAGWLPNFEVPRVFSQFGATIHVPRRPYSQALPGIPTIRVFEALACGIPLVCSWWEDCERLFGPEDFLVARSGREMSSHLRAVLHDPGLARTLAQRGLKTIHARHTCEHRVNELLAIVDELKR